MNWKQIAGLVVMSVCCQAGTAGDYRQITLNDGSVISGEVTSFDGNRYIVKSTSLGTVEIDSSEINVIKAPPASGNTTRAPAVSPGELMSMQEQLARDPDIMLLIKNLQQDPQIQAILADPQLMQSVLAGDIQALMNNPDFNALMNNPAIRQIQEKALSQ
jgi:hypothetical protein